MPIIEKIPPQKTVWINIFFPLTNQTVYCYHKNLGIIDDFSPHIWTLSTSNPVCAWSMCTEQVFQRKNYENCHLIPRCIKCVKCSIMPKPNFGFKIDFSVFEQLFSKSFHNLFHSIELICLFNVSQKYFPISEKNLEFLIKHSVS